MPLLFWKTVLLLIGGSADLKKCKAVLRESGETDNDRGEGFITASPLDYHLFRQEITSKYPAYCPPLPLVPIEPENNSILPPLPNHPSRRISQDSLSIYTSTSHDGTGGSIFNQPVHIATPAPSPPPSPAGPGGKGGKKQNYQTNQNFPFLYPPVDGSANLIGGKGNAKGMERIIGKRWDGTDVPASIQEAGQLFASRMRMSRSLRQMWDVREKFVEYERGWDGNEDKKDECSSDASDSEDGSEKGSEKAEKHGSKDHSLDEARVKKEKETDNVDVQRRLDVVEAFYVSPSLCASDYSSWSSAQRSPIPSIRDHSLLENNVRERVRLGKPVQSGNGDGKRLYISRRQQ